MYTIIGDSMNWYIKDYIDYVYIEKKLSSNTKEAYYRDLIYFSKYINKEDVTKINTNDIRKYVNHLSDIKEADKTIARKLVSIRTFFDYLVMNKIISDNPCQKIESPKLKKTLPKVLNIDEVNKLLNIEPKTALEYRNKVMIELMYATGLRVSELVNLTINDINLTDNYVRCFGKGKKERIVPIGNTMNNLLDEYINVHRNALLKGYLTDKLFLSSYGKGITRQGFFKILKQTGKEVGIIKDFSPHTLRHSFASHMLEYGADIRSIGELLGHENIKTTEIYTHLTNPKLKNDYKSYHPRDKF